MREIIVLDRNGGSVTITFNEANSEIVIDDGGRPIVLEHEETAKLQNWFLSL